VSASLPSCLSFPYHTESPPSRPLFPPSDTSVGYTQGDMEKPTYEAVCTGMTKHTEVVQVRNTFRGMNVAGRGAQEGPPLVCVQVFYDDKKVSFESLCRVLLDKIDPTLPNQVGNDRGSQYR
jgi:peptide-methionine (S)-S-oxide reductase